MFHHIAMFRLKDDVDPSALASFRSELLALPGKIDTIRHYHVGRDAGLREGNWDLVIVAAFDDEAGYRTYAQHPDHLPLLDRLPDLFAARAAVQTGDFGSGRA